MSSPRRGLTVGLLLCVLAVAFETQAVLTAMPAAAADLGDLHLYAWAFTAVMIPQLVAIAYAGRLCDTVGPARPALVGLAVFAIGVVICALAPSMLVLLAGRFVQGLGGGGINLSLMVVTGQAFPPEERARVMTWYSACWMLPSFLGPAVAAWLTEQLSWHAVFWAVLPFVVLGAAFVTPALLRLPAPPEGGHDDHVPRRAAIGVAAAAALLQVAGQRLDPVSALLAALGLGLLVAFFRSLMPRGFAFGASGLSATVLTRLVSAGSFFGVQSFLPLMLVQRGVDLLVAGGAITVASLGWMAGSWLQARPWLRLSRDRIVAAGTACVAAGLLVVAFAAWTPALGLVAPVAGSTLAGLGMGLATSSTSLVVMQLSSRGELGRNTSSLQLGEMLGNALLGGLAGTVFAALGPASGPAAFGWVCLALSVTAIAGVVTAARIGHVENQAARAAS